MKSILAIALRDFKSVVISPLFFLLAGLFTIMWNANFANGLYNFSLAASSINYAGKEGLSLYSTVFLSHFAYYNLIIIFVAPALTMKLFAEEKKMGTYDLLLTSPIESWQIVLGKFFGGFSATLCFAALSFMYPFSVSFLTDYNHGPLFSIFLAVFFITALYVAVGIFASSLTRSVVLAVILSVVFNFFIWFLGQFAPQTDSEMMIVLFEQLSLVQHFQHLLIGKIKLSSLIYFISGITLFVFLTERVVESSRWRS